MAKTQARSSATAALDHWEIKSQSDTDIVWALLDFRGTELGALPENAGLEAQFYHYEPLDLLADEFALPDPEIKMAAHRRYLRNWRNYIQSLIGGAIGAIIVLALTHHL